MANLDTENLALESLSEQVAALSVDDLVVQHRRERRELQAKIQALKKNAPKNDKKKRKEVMEEVSRLENEIEQRHKNELKTAEERAANSRSQVEPNNDGNAAAAADTKSNNGKQSTGNEATEQMPERKDNQQQPQRISKAQKRRDKKAREAREREEFRRVELISSNSESSPKVVESKVIDDKLQYRNLALHHIASDGNCLYNAVRHQLTEHGLPIHSVSALRSETANYIRAHKDDLIQFMTDPATGDLLTDDEFDKYCEAIRNTAAWGGEVELNALAVVLKVAIEVIQAAGPPTTHGAGEPKLIVTYHRYLYQLGEHYNSTMPKPQKAAVEDKELPAQQ